MTQFYEWLATIGEEADWARLPTQLLTESTVPVNINGKPSAPGFNSALQVHGNDKPPTSRRDSALRRKRGRVACEANIADVVSKSQIRL